MSARDTQVSDARVAHWIERHRWSHRCLDCHHVHGHAKGCPSDRDADATGYSDENDSIPDIS